MHAAVDRAGNVDSLELAEQQGATQQTPLGDVDCVWEEWTDWSACQFTCGDGTAMRTRKVKMMAQGNGAACDNNLMETRECAKIACPVDCSWDEWSDWTTCSMSCGVGLKAKTRKFKQVAAYGGLPCQGLTTQTSECTLGECPVDCKYGDWDAWSGCSVSCGGGFRKRYRPVAVTPNLVGKQCESVGKNVENADCGQNNCPVDCELEDWTSWDLCDVSCGQGVTQRTRAIKGNGAAFGGQPCGVLFQNKTCDNGECPADCKLSDWSDWHACDVTCGPGVRKRARIIAEKGNILGAKCPTDEASRTQIESCSMNGCPVDCKMSDWTEWTGCSVTCSSGITERYRENLVHAEYGGRPCHHNTTYEKKYCSLNPCPVDCEWDDWQDWRGCTTTCGNGTSLRMRIVKTPELHGGQACGSGYSQTRQCNLRYCPLHCQWNDWADWSSCSTSCGDGSQGRSRQVAIEADYGGLPCTGNTQQSRTCTDGACPIHCAWGDWQDWSFCSSSCDHGKHSRTRSMATEPMYGGEECKGSAADIKNCTDLPLCPVDCEWDEWTDWQACSKTCGNDGFSRRARVRKQYESNGGHVCYGTEDDEQSCTLPNCPILCEVGDWSPWGACSHSCTEKSLDDGASTGLDGEHTRTRGIKIQPRYGAPSCPSLVDKKPCELGACPRDCKWSDWEEWGRCSKSCEGGVTSRFRKEAETAKNGGQSCHGASREDSPCNVETCPVNCEWHEWSDWSSCPVTCGSGIRTQTRQIKTPAKGNGTECETTNDKGGPATVKTDSCEEQNCPVDCCWSSWTGFSLCSKSCESGTMSRTRVKDPPESDGGLACIGDSIETNLCNTQGCPQDCQWGPWSKWTECSRKCGGGKIKRFRDIAVSRKNGGEKCAGLFEQEADCNVAECAKNCLWGDWSEWSTCPVTCNGGFRLRNRPIRQIEEHGGTPCDGNKTERATCSTAACPVDCYFKPWSDWYPCSATCNGDRLRTRVKVKEMFDGKPCEGEMLERGPCNGGGAQGCPTTAAPTTTTTTTTTKKPIKPCNRSDPSNEIAQINDAIKNFQSHQTSSTDETSSTTSASTSVSVQNESGQANRSADLDVPVAYASNDIADVAGDLSLDVADADRFISSINVAQAMTQAIASIGQVRPEAVKVRLSLSQASLLATWRRRATGNVNVAYIINMTAGSGRKSSDVAYSISHQEVSKVSAQIQKLLNSSGVSISARAVSISVTLLPKDEGSDDAASLMDQEKSHQKGVESLEADRVKRSGIQVDASIDKLKSIDVSQKPETSLKALAEEGKQLAETVDESIEVEKRVGKEHETKSGKTDTEKLANEVEMLIQTLKAQNEASAIKQHEQKNAGLVESPGMVRELDPSTKSAASLASFSWFAVAAATVAFMV
eukprot:TRINITY_DN5216_c0_g3_i1.p1 TRINITY_DN5216_c0_g3~~TRINITY_DN5216_c0_g3_i1.p1  ORF type:complete len:1485 (+),score=229.48 TRINITY_DN5216_c0_g3_i1:302-4456(+)